MKKSNIVKMVSYIPAVVRDDSRRKKVLTENFVVKLMAIAFVAGYFLVHYVTYVTSGDMEVAKDASVGVGTASAMGVPFICLIAGKIRSRIRS